MWITPLVFFFFNDTATTEIYTLSLHDALPIFTVGTQQEMEAFQSAFDAVMKGSTTTGYRSEEHTSELQSQSNLVCRLLLEKKKSRPIVHRRRSPLRLPSPGWTEPSIRTDVTPP